MVRDGNDREFPRGERHFSPDLEGRVIFPARFRGLFFLNLAAVDLAAVQWGDTLAIGATNFLQAPRSYARLLRNAASLHAGAGQGGPAIGKHAAVSPVSISPKPMEMESCVCVSARGYERACR
jgi:hypothetical protein